MANHLPPAHGYGGEIGRDRRADSAARGASGEPPIIGDAAASVAASYDWGGRAPFACQHGDRLLLLEPKSPGWILAELRFDAGGCRYVEVRRACYRWAREAAGALLSRALAEGDAAADRADRALRDWLIAE